MINQFKYLHVETMNFYVIFSHERSNFRYVIPESTFIKLFLPEIACSSYSSVTTNNMPIYGTSFLSVCLFDATKPFTLIVSIRVQLSFKSLCIILLYATGQILLNEKFSLQWSVAINSKYRNIKFIQSFYMHDIEEYFENLKLFQYYARVF